MLRIAHVSDTHFGGSADAAERCRRVLAHVAALRPQVDVVLVTGDIADQGTPEEYHQAAEQLDSWPGPAPLLTCPGNHDVRSDYLRWRGLSGDGSDDQPANTAHDVGGARFVMLDSLVAAAPGERVDHGHLADVTLEYLDRHLGSRPAGVPAFVCLHHPPVELHVGLMDPIRLDNADALADVLSRHPDVRAVMVGHAHTACATTFSGVPLLVGGGCVSTVTLDEEPLATVDYDLPPTLALHLVGADGRLVTHFRSLPGAGG